MPDAQWAQLIAVHVSVGLNTTSIPENASFLVWLVGLVVSVQRYRQSLLALADLAHENGARIANICAEDFGADDEDGDACRSTESQVNLRVSKESLLNQDEALVELFLDLRRVDDTLSNLRLVKGRLDSLLDILSKSGLDEFRHLLSEDTMTITDREEVGSSVFAEMGENKVGVLVDFVGVLGAEAGLRCKGELSDTVIKLLLRRLGLGYRLRRGHLSSD